MEIGDWRMWGQEFEISDLIFGIGDWRFEDLIPGAGGSGDDLQAV